MAFMPTLLLLLVGGCLAEPMVGGNATTVQEDNSTMEKDGAMVNRSGFANFDYYAYRTGTKRATGPTHLESWVLEVWRIV